MEDTHDTPHTPGRLRATLVTLCEESPLIVHTHIELAVGLELQAMLDLSLVRVHVEGDEIRLLALILHAAILDRLGERACNPANTLPVVKDLLIDELVGEAKFKHFQHAGYLMTADGTDDDLIKLEGAPAGYKVVVPSYM